MVRIRITSVITSNGYLSQWNDLQFSWLENNPKGLPFWRKTADRILANEISFLSLINEKRLSSNDSILLAEITTENQLPLLKGLFRYGLVDEVILYITPTDSNSKDGLLLYPYAFPISSWNLESTREFPNGIRQLIYWRNI